MTTTAAPSILPEMSHLPSISAKAITADGTYTSPWLYSQYCPKGSDTLRTYSVLPPSPNSYTTMLNSKVLTDWAKNFTAEHGRDPLPAEVLLEYAKRSCGSQGSNSAFSAVSEDEIYVVTEDEALDIEDAINRERFGKVHLITKSEWWEALEVLPPLDTGATGDFKWFLMSERTTGDWTAMYGCVRLTAGEYVYASKTVNLKDRSTWLTGSEILALV